MSGEFTVVNPALIEDLKKQKLWNETLLNQLKTSDGSVQNIPEISQELKDRYKTAFEIDIAWLISCIPPSKVDGSKPINKFIHGKTIRS